ncbi:MAG: histidinol dehydrogenase [Planctomycetota bacterium]
MNTSAPTDALLPVLHLDLPDEAARVHALVDQLRLDARDLFRDDDKTAAVRKTLEDVASRGDDALVESARRFDDPDFTADQIRVTPDEMAEAAARLPEQLATALKQAIEQVRAYQQHIMPPAQIDPLTRPGVELGLRYTPIRAAGCYFPGGKASYPSSLIHLAVPAQVAGVRDVVCVTPPSKYGKSDLVLAAGHALGLPFMIRAGGAAAVAALAFGTDSVPRVDKIVGPGNTYVQIAKRLVSGGVGVDGFLGPSEVLVFADHTAEPAFVAADLMAQAEHDPGSCYLLTTDPELPAKVLAEIDRQLPSLSRRPAIERALAEMSAIVVSEDKQSLYDLAADIAPEHMNVQTENARADLANLPHAGCTFIGPMSPVAAGDYVAGPSHCLPTNTTARFAGGISVLEFLKRGSLVRYEEAGLRHDAASTIALADAEGLDGHANSVRVRVESGQ